MTPARWAVPPPAEGSTLLVASENGLGKRTDFAEYRQQSRGGKGIITMKVTDRTGPVVGAVTVTPEDELMLMTSTGQSIRIRVAEIRETGRNAMGVKLLTLKDGEKLQDISRFIPDGEDAEAGDGAPTAADESEADESEADESEADESEADESAASSDSAEDAHPG